MSRPLLGSLFFCKVVSVIKGNLSFYHCSAFVALANLGYISDIIIIIILHARIYSYWARFTAVISQCSMVPFF